MAETIGDRLKRMRLEAGERRPFDKTLRQIASKLGTTAYYLETGKTTGRCPHCGAVL